MKLRKHVKSDDSKATFTQKMCFDLVFFFVRFGVFALSSEDESSCVWVKTLRLYFTMCENRKGKGTGKGKDGIETREATDIRIW